MEDLHQIPVGVGIIFPENQPVVVQLFKINGFAGERVPGGTDTNCISFKEFTALVILRGAVGVYDTELDAP